MANPRTKWEIGVVKVCAVTWTCSFIKLSPHPLNVKIQEELTTKKGPKSHFKITFLLDLQNYCWNKWGQKDCPSAHERACESRERGKIISSPDFRPWPHGWSKLPWVSERCGSASDTCLPPPDASRCSCFLWNLYSSLPSCTSPVSVGNLHSLSLLTPAVASAAISTLTICTF